MSLQATQAALIQQSFEAVKPIADNAAKLFYARLFELDPSLRPLFRSDMTEQGRKLMALLGVAAANARNPESLRTPLEQLAKRHVGYGVRLEHFETVGAALLWTLEKGLGEGFTPDVREAWAALYDEIVLIMASQFVAAQPIEPLAHRPMPRPRPSFFTRLAFWR
jgi:nitric oxide dioxygenase